LLWRGRSSYERSRLRILRRLLCPSKRLSLFHYGCRRGTVASLRSVLRLPTTPRTNPENITTAHSTQHTTYSIPHTTYNIPHTTYNIPRTTYNIQHTTYNIQHTTYHVQPLIFVRNPPPTYRNLHLTRSSTSTTTTTTTTTTTNIKFQARSGSLRLSPTLRHPSQSHTLFKERNRGKTSSQCLLAVKTTVILVVIVMARTFVI
jgi:hypothetical protein